VDKFKFKMSFLYPIYGTPEEEEAKRKAAEEEAAKKKTENAKLYTEAEFNSHTAGLRHKYESENKKLADQLKSVHDSLSGSDATKAELSKRIEDLEKTYMTEKEIKDRELAQSEKKRKEEVEGVTKERDTYKKSYEDLTIDIELSREAALAEELIPGQLSKFVRPDTVLADEIDETTAKPTGKKVVKIKFNDVDTKTKKPIELLLTPSEAFKRMKETPERHGNFFKATVNGGLGGNNRGGSNGAPPKDTESYISQRNASKGK
jgi:hypothetical protein